MASVRDIVLTLAGAVFGVILGALFEESLKRRLDRVRKMRLRRRGKRALPGTEELPANEHRAFRFGPLRTPLYIIDGNGESRYRPENVEISVLPEALELPTELMAIRNEIEARELRKKELNGRYFWNGLNYAVSSFAVSRTGLTEESEVRIVFQPSDYYNFRVGLESLDRYVPEYGKTVRQNFLEPFYWTKPVSCLSSSFGVNVVVITADNKLIVSTRSELVGSRPLELSVSANEGLSRGVDDAGGNPPNLYACAYRALKEELGIRRDEVDGFSLLGFHIDLRLHQWGCHGVARLKSLTFDDVRGRFTRAPKDTFEHIDIDGPDFSPLSVAEYVLNPKRSNLWTAGAPACFYYSLVFTYGLKNVEDSIKSVSKKRKTMFDSA